MQTANQPVESVGETHLLNQTIQVERKHITFGLAEKPRGRFLRITEETSGRRSAIIIPLPGLEEFRDAVTKVIEFSKPPAKPARPLPSVPRKRT
jgi:hypothetical protein